jgi:hypothetical protein
MTRRAVPAKVACGLVARAPTDRRKSELTQGYWGSRRAVSRFAAMLLLLLASVVVPTACGSSERAPSSDRPSVQAIAAALAESSGSGDAGAKTGEVRTSEGGRVTIQVSWENGGATGAPLAFSVVMDTHSVDLDGYDLGRLAVLRNDRGQEVKPQRWDAPPGGHHRSGTLLFPERDSAGNPMVGPEVKAMELLIRDVAGVEERVLRWEAS